MSMQIDFEQLLHALGDGVIVSDTSGKITFWNAAATRIFGFAENEAIGQSLDLIVPQRQRDRHWDGYHKTMATGQTRYGADLLRVPALHKEGKPLSIAFTVALLHGSNGEVSAIVALVRDETERWSEERKLRARLAQLETAQA
ncbi:PAS domain-containing protein [Massilia sp. YIM B02443]|uniref:PAS domain-containing protein n=1 Tax=Massilia sp. YIM B02443 TaxID=3050127 RepID=UPI0025B62E6A|nr:PAS domain-containing protein [Massilia sp. YIM B02443]